VGHTRSERVSIAPCGVILLGPDTVTAGSLDVWDRRAQGAVLPREFCANTVTPLLPPPFGGAEGVPQEGLQRPHGRRLLPPGGKRQGHRAADARAAEGDDRHR